MGSNEINIDMVSFDTFDWPELSRGKQQIIWRSESQPAQLSINYFHRTPDLPRKIHQPNALPDYFRKKVLQQNGGLIKVASTRLDFLPAIETIFKIPMPTKGLIYVGSYTIPFSHDSFVVKVQAQEYFDIGGREKMMEEKLRAQNQLQLNEQGGVMNWKTDPYDPDQTLGMLMNQSEKEQYDLFFAEHPLSVVRASMYRIAQSIRFDEKLRELEPYSVS